MNEPFYVFDSEWRWNFQGGSIIGAEWKTKVQRGSDGRFAWFENVLRWMVTVRAKFWLESCVTWREGGGVWRWCHWGFEMSCLVPVGADELSTFLVIFRRTVWEERTLLTKNFESLIFVKILKEPKYRHDITFTLRPRSFLSYCGCL